MSRSAFVTPGGVRHVIEEAADGSLIDHAYQDTDAILDVNKAMATENDGYSPSREIRRAATVPHSVMLKWLVEDGFWFYDAFSGDEFAKRKLRQKLNDPDWAHLRTAPGRL